IIDGISGIVADCEMLLVLGRPRSGCSTLLRILDNRRKTLTLSEVEEHYYSGVAYHYEANVHLLMLTVHKTLGFAIQFKTPSTRMDFCKRNIRCYIEVFQRAVASEQYMIDSFSIAEGNIASKE
ncbi:ATP-binding cassette transporter snq2, partial [Coemansia sp. RSA 1933]